MPLQLSAIPAHIRDTVVQKLDLLDFVNFSQVSWKGFNAAQNVRTKYAIENPDKENKYIFTCTTVEPSRLFLRYLSKELKLKVNNSSRCGGEGSCLPVENVKGKYASEVFYQYSTVPVTIELMYENEELKFEFDSGSVVGRKFKNFSEELFDAHPVRLDNCNIQLNNDFTEEYCQKLTHFLRRTRTSVNCLHFCVFSPISCSPRSLSELIEAGRIEKLLFNQRLSFDFMKVEGIRNKAVFMLGEFMEESEVLAFNVLKCTVFSSNFSNDGANKFIKEVLAGERTIDEITINTTRTLETDVIFEGIPILGRIKHGQRRESVYVENGCIFRVTIDDGYFSICEW